MHKNIFVFILLLYCSSLKSQTEDWEIIVDTDVSINCDQDSTGLIPLTDMGNTYYNGVQGGLYKGGMNILNGPHKKKGVNISKNMKPLDTLGNIDYVNGEVLFLGLGASVASNLFNAYVDTVKAHDNEGMSACVTVRGMFTAGKDLDDMIDTINPGFWLALNERMVLKDDSYEQVQVLWILQQSDSDTSNDFTTYYNSVMSKYITLMQVLKDSFPNLKQVYLSGIHYTGYMYPEHKRYDAYGEPKGYWANLVIKQLIQKQISGDPALAYQGPNIKSAWIGWGPYFWADGINPRTYDGLSWSCDQYRTDSTGAGFHLIDSSYGFGIEASMVKNFMETNPVSSVWYNYGPLWIDCGVDTARISKYQNINDHIQVYPNPVQHEFTIILPELISGQLSISIYNELGTRVHQKFYENYNSPGIDMEINLPNGIYFTEIICDNYKYRTKFIVVN
ncbi:MAG: T9SS type A sorting domain-containing protein [Chitinophagales bacterium]|jgi:hypothetical protein|nr:T9SS type A sorting domain-containing protein [Bacteroidota bacterium]MBK7568859.1 T9SS type A sorting domain-containing protein [Bacteroidota bacterium]MBP8915408.1 T9SS type A sorting domain-containing protein [Chitinophagales bacterium]MBP9220331.1 T9SS type A sorting domain-containing protein [Chitinophagales bacterium]MBP9794613.1 T9SS type A sorting domain-containing protein [Chitinophagales bacterium]